MAADKRAVTDAYLAWRIFAIRAALTERNNPVDYHTPDTAQLRFELATLEMLTARDSSTAGTTD